MFSRRSWDSCCSTREKKTAMCTAPLPIQVCTLKSRLTQSFLRKLFASDRILSRDHTWRVAHPGGQIQWFTMWSSIIHAFINYLRNIYMRRFFNSKLFLENLQDGPEPCAKRRIGDVLSALTDHFPFLQSFFFYANLFFRNHFFSFKSYIVSTPEIDDPLYITCSRNR